MRGFKTVNKGDYSCPMMVTKSEPLDAQIDAARKLPTLRGIVIPPCPALLARLQDALAGAEPDVGEIGEIAGADVAMAATVIRAANGPLHGLTHPVVTVGQALTVLGVQPAIELLTEFIVRKALPVHSPALDHFWESSQRRAIACEHIGQQLYSFDAGLGHSFGLFCHVGMPVLMKAVKGYSGTLTEALARKDRSFTQTENANHQTDHAVVGAIVARTWRLSSDVAQAIWLHHDFASLDEARFSPTVKNLVALGLVADHLVARYEQLPPAREWTQYGSKCQAHLQIGDDEIEAWIDTLHDAFAAVQL